MMAFLEVSDLKLYYKHVRGFVRAVDNISFDIEKGEALGVVGESGSGKTSIGLALTRVLPNNIHTYEGQIVLEGRNILDLSDEDFRRTIRWKVISTVFQGSMNSLNPVLKVGYQVAEPLLQDMSKKDALMKAKELFHLVGLSDYVFERYPHELSGGMKQRVVIASSLILSPKLVVLDEPTSALDVSIQAQIMNLLKKLKRELKVSMVFITHDIALASDICDKVAVLYAGEIIEKGTSEHIFNEPQHPYTQLLLKSIPRLKSESPLKFISGAPPDLVSPPVGCRFHPRCPSRFDPCDKTSPPQYEVKEGHTANCWLLWESEKR